MKYQVYHWKDWLQLCLDYDVDPYEEQEFGIDKGGGNSDDYRYVGDVPEREADE